MERPLLPGVPCKDEERRSMGTLLLHNPWVQFYLLFVGALGVVFIWDYWRNPPADREHARTLANKAAQGKASPPRRLPSQGLCSVSRPWRRTDKEVGPTAGTTTGGALRVSVAAPTSGKRRKHHVVSS
jgi:hypothetical protein